MVKVEIAEEVEGDRFETTDYYFERIGVPISIKEDDAHYDLENPPSQSLAISERRRLVFLPHSSGFFVGRTKDVISAAKDSNGKGSKVYIQDLSLVDVPVGDVRILSLSADDSILAVSVAADIHFFSVDSLLQKDATPSFTYSPDESGFVKDFRWTTKDKHSYLVLSNHGKLFHGIDNAPPKHVMDGVDAVEWSSKGSYIAVAQDNSLRILSSKFNEKRCIALSFDNWIGDSTENCVVKVDSIRWVRQNCILLGCFLLIDGMEENYLVQVIRSPDGKITDSQSNLVALSFSDLFPCSMDDLVPVGVGPHLLFSYIDQCKLAITANRKSIDEHVVLLNWSPSDDQSAVTVVDIDRETYLPRIGLQENGDDNTIMGLCTDTVSVEGSVKVGTGDDDMKELSPYCVLLCLTLEGKLVMYNVASVAGLPTTSDFDLVSSSDIEDAYAPSTGDDLSNQSSEEPEPQWKLNASIQNEKRSLTSENSVSLLPTEQRFPNEENSRKEIESFKTSVSGDINGKQAPYAEKSLQAADAQQSMVPRQFGTSFGKPLLSSGYDTNKFAESSSILPVSDKLQKEKSEQSSSLHFPSSFSSKSTAASFSFPGMQNAFVPSPENTPPQPWSSGKGVSAPGFLSGPFPSVKDTQHKQSEQTGSDYVNPPTTFKEKPVQVIESARASALGNITPPQGQNQDSDEGVEKIEPIPSIRASQLSLQVKSSFEKSSGHQQHKSPLNPGPLISTLFAHLIFGFGKKRHTLMVCISKLLITSTGNFGTARVASTVFDQTEKNAGEIKFSEGKANVFLDTAAESSQASSSRLSRTSLNSASTLSTPSAPSVSSSTKDSVPATTPISLAPAPQKFSVTWTSTVSATSFNVPFGKSLTSANLDLNQAATSTPSQPPGPTAGFSFRLPALSPSSPEIASSSAVASTAPDAFQSPQASTPFSTVSITEPVVSEPKKPEAQS
ncbi:unnamed protein product [Microthlaspi erraticum]|uniref:Nucleoporin Nup159/Nup146 N-terminal domain-containing protein n=1 Tax=Microthlaspi erraticum TaxID=1685480 RepID=A0A6D2HLD7_9BRAS|nr:unnamed protein product [Microthlaspi erraticum]